MNPEILISPAASRLFFGDLAPFEVCITLTHTLPFHTVFAYPSHKHIHNSARVEAPE